MVARNGRTSEGMSLLSSEKRRSAMWSEYKADHVGSYLRPPELVEA